MKELLEDKRFVHIAKDPKFRRIPKNERKIKIDKRFQSMFKDEKFSITYTVDKRGRPINETSKENLKKYYDISTDEEDSSDEKDSSDEEENKQSAKQEIIKKISKVKNGTKGKTENDKTSASKEDNSENSDEKNYSSCGSLLLLKKPQEQTTDEEDVSTEEDAVGKTDLKKNKNELKSKNSNIKLDKNVKEKLHDMSIDYARGEGVLLSESSSDESSEYESDAEIEHNWGELDKDAETTDEISNRLAVCNLDWDRIRASDLMVLFNSFLPPGGLIQKVTIYPSEFGLKRMKEEEVKGPLELVECKNENSYESEDEFEEGSDHEVEKLRQYQLNRLKYYYAVLVFDTAHTADKVYSECNGLEYESSSSKLDLRFIPDDMTFDQEPKEVCDTLPDFSKYQPRQFVNSALQQVKVDLTWDETNLERQEFSQKVNSGKFDELDKNDIQTYLASGSSEDESEDEIKKQLEKIDETEDQGNSLDKYKSLLKSIEQAEEEKRNKDVELEFTWGLDVKKETDELIEEKSKKNTSSTPFEQYLEKRKAKKKARKDQKNNSSKDEDITSDIDSELNRKNSKSKKRKNTSIDSAIDEEEQEKQRAELELLLMEENDSNKNHFSMKQIEKSEALKNSKRKRRNKKMKEESNIDDFEVNVEDPRFTALYTSHHYNIDPADPHYRKTKGTEAIINEKLRRSSKKDTHYNINI